MKHMQKILFAIAFLFAGTAFGQQDKLFENRSLNKDLNLKVNIGATQTTLIQMEGANGATRIIVPDGAQTVVKSTDAAGAIFRDASGAAVVSTWLGLKSNGGGATTIQSYVNTGDDSGPNPSLTFDTRIVDGTGVQTSLATRPAFGWSNNGTSIGSVSAAGAWRLGVDGANTMLLKGYVHGNANGGTPINSPGGNTSAIFQNNDTTSRTNNVYIIGGTAGGAVLAFGDSGTPSKGSIAFANGASSNTGAFTISNNMVFNGDGTAAKYFQFQGAGSSSLASTDNTISKNFSLLVPASGAGATVYTLLGMMSVIMQASYVDTGIVMRLGGTNHQIRATFWLSSEGFNGPGETQPNIFSLAWATPTTVTNVSAATANFHSISDADFRWVNPGTSTPCNTTTCSLQCKLNGGPATAITLSGIVIVNAG